MASLRDIMQKNSKDIDLDSLIEKSSGAKIRVGKNKDNDIVIPAKFVHVSRYHGQLVKTKGGEWCWQDTKNSNPTSFYYGRGLGGVITDKELHSLHDGVILDLADYKFIFFEEKINGKTRVE